MGKGENKGKVDMAVFLLSAGNSWDWTGDQDVMKLISFEFTDYMHAIAISNKKLEKVKRWLDEL